MFGNEPPPLPDPPEDLWRCANFINGMLDGDVGVIVGCRLPGGISSSSKRRNASAAVRHAGAVDNAKNGYLVTAGESLVGAELEIVGQLIGKRKIGTLMSISAKLGPEGGLAVKLHYQDGEEGWEDLGSAKWRLLCSPAAGVLASHSLVGSRISAYWEGSRAWFDGTIHSFVEGRKKMDQGLVAMIHYDNGEKKKLRPTTAKGGCEREAEPALFGELRLRRAARRPSQQRFNVLPKPTSHRTTSNNCLAKRPSQTRASYPP